MPLAKKRSCSFEVQSSNEQSMILLRHAEILMASKVERTRIIDEKHVKAFHQSSEGEEFRGFRKTGIAARISNLNAVYLMYLNNLDK